MHEGLDLLEAFSEAAAWIYRRTNKFLLRVGCKATSSAKAHHFILSSRLQDWAQHCSLEVIFLKDSVFGLTVVKLAVSPQSRGLVHGLPMAKQQGS